MDHETLSPATRRLVTLFTMASAIMNQVDTTIANVALPHMQGSVSASREQITWVLTSYIVAAAIATPFSGWLASRFGRRRLLLISIVGFTGVSGLCGIAQNLDELILFRLLQGVFGAALVPMSQATLLDIYPTEEHGRAMSIFGLAAIVGPVMGPLLGGYLTENLSWRWCFYINLPIGLFSFIGLYALMPENRAVNPARLDFTGFGFLALALGAFQLMLDRGTVQDWFSSTEICVEAAMAVVGLYLFVVHITTTENPFVSLAVFKDRNFVICGVVGFFLGVLIYSPMSLLPQMLDSMFDYPIMQIGLLMAPRGIGTLFAMLVVQRIIGKVDMRVMVIAGLVFSAASLFLMSGLSLQADGKPIIISGILQGIGSSIIFVPLSTMAFATLPARYRNEGAALSTLTRNFGAAVGIAATQAFTIRSEAAVQSRLVEGLRPDNPIVAFRMPGADLFSAQTAARLQGEVLRQATMVSYIDAFWVLFILGLASSVLLFFIRSPRQR
jgi:DHA2 family multidrug resistance protein